MIVYSHSMVRTGILGASGYTGAELLRLAAGHPELDVVYATADSMAGTRAGGLFPSVGGAYPDLVFETFDPSAVEGLDPCSLLTTCRGLAPRAPLA